MSTVNTITEIVTAKHGQHVASQQSGFIAEAAAAVEGKTSEEARTILTEMAQSRLGRYGVPASTINEVAEAVGSQAESDAVTPLTDAQVDALVVIGVNLGADEDAVLDALVEAGLHTRPEPEPEPEADAASVVDGGVDSGLFQRLVEFARRHGFSG